jgi:uncharacterized membrane protein YagU involved in acid resistance
VGEIRRGFVAGLWGVLAMVGITFIIRRFMEPETPTPKMHYEAVVEWAHDAVTAEDVKLDSKTRIYLGEISHLLFGAFWGIVFALLLRGKAIRPWPQGIRLGTTLWLGAFAGYLPALKIAKPIWEMGCYRAARTWVTHVTFSVTTLTVLRSMRKA